jgi:O-antigen ligase
MGLPSSQAVSDAKPGFFGVVLAAYLAITISRIHEVVPYLTHLYLGKVSAALLLMAAFSRIRGSDIQRVFRTPVAKYVAILTGLALVSVPGSAWPKQSFTFFQDWWPQVMLMFVCVCAGFANRRTAYLCVVTVTLSAGFAALVMMATNNVDGGGRAFIGTYSAATYDANMSAALFVLALPYAAMLAVRRGWTRWAGIALIPLLIAATLATASRGGVLALAVLGVTTVVFAPKQHRPKYIGLLVLAVAIAPFLPHSGLATRWAEFMQPGGDYNMTSRDGRIEVWKRGIGFMITHPVLGVGVRSYEIAGGTLAHSWVNAHNAFIQVGAELGVGGLVVFVMMVSAGLRLALQARRRLSGSTTPSDELGRGLMTAAFSALVAVIASAMFLSMAYDAITLFALAVPTGLALSFRGGARPAGAGAPAAHPRGDAPGWRSNRLARPAPRHVQART